MQRHFAGSGRKVAAGIVMMMVGGCAVALLLTLHSRGLLGIFSTALTVAVSVIVAAIGLGLTATNLRL